MFLKVLRISASNVLKMFLNIIVSIDYWGFPSNQPEAQILFIELAATLAGKKEILYENKK